MAALPRRFAESASIHSDYNVLNTTLRKHRCRMSAVPLNTCASASLSSRSLHWFDADRSAPAAVAEIATQPPTRHLCLVLTKPQHAIRRSIQTLPWSRPRC